MTWKCPKCETEACPEVCPDPEKCHTRVSSDSHRCEGLICECDGDTLEGHGDSFNDVCTNANCYHCGWGGQMPPKPKKILQWEKKALESGWTPPKGWDT